MDTSKAVHYLSLGLPPSQVASIVGVSPGRISQLLADPEIKKQIAIKELDDIQRRSPEEERIDAKILSVKNTILDGIAASANEATFMELARAYEMISRAESLKKNPLPLAGTNLFAGMTVQISIPQRVLEHEIHVTGEKEVIAIGDKTLAPLPSAQVTELFKRMKGEQDEPKSLPGSAA